MYLAFVIATEEHLYLGGIVRLNYTIIDLEKEDVYLASMNIAVCENPNCTVSHQVLNEVKLPKRPCSYLQDFVDPGKTFWIRNKFVDLDTC